MEKQIDKILDNLIKHDINRNEAKKELLNLFSVMPSLLYFKEQRHKLGLSLRQVAEQTGVSFPTISRIEQGREAEYSNVVALFKFYRKEA